MSSKPSTVELSRLLRARFEAANEVRRGVCLLNAGHFEEATKVFIKASQLGSTDRSLPAYLAACWMGQDRPGDAADALRAIGDERPPRSADRIRYALARWAAGDLEEAIESLRDAISTDPENPELHFQLGTILADAECYEEAELRFTQAVNIDREHTEAMVSLALCLGLRGAMTEALSHLRRAQVRRPYDARIGLLLAQASRAVQQQGLNVRLHAAIEADSTWDAQGIEELSRVIESDPEFVDAFLSIPAEEVDEQVFAMLLKTLEMVLERQPEHAELHFHCGRVLHRLGRRDEAIDENERALELDPRFIRALIELGKLYQQTDRHADAATRLEEAIAAGAEYADVYYLLGNLYRDRGEVHRAGRAYRRALSINNQYAAAQRALEDLLART